MAKKIPLNEITMFSHLSEDVLADVENSLTKRELKSGDILFNQGDPGDELIIIEEGALAIFTPDEKGEGEAFRVFEPGEMMGEMAIIDSQPRSASARAETDTVVLTLSKDEFQELISNNPIMAQSVMSGLNDRIRYTTSFLGEVRKWVSKISEGDYKTEITTDHYTDNSLATLAEEFAKMAAEVKEREEELKKEVAQLKIMIDQTKRKQDVKEIMSSDLYHSLEEAKKKKGKKAQ